MAPGNAGRCSLRYPLPVTDTKVSGTCSPVIVVSSITFTQISAQWINGKRNLSKQLPVPDTKDSGTYRHETQTAASPVEISVVAE